MCEKNYTSMGYNGFLCRICRKVWSSLKGAIKDLRKEVVEMGNRIVVLEMEKETLAQKVERMEMKTDKVKEGLAGVEKEVVSGMETAKQEVKKVVRAEISERGERSANLVLYGIEESKEAEMEKRKEYDEKKVREVAEKIGVEIKGEMVVKFRAGKKSDEATAKPRPLIVKVSDDETRERFFKNAPLLARTDNMKRVFISSDLTWEQREEARKVERELRAEAERKTEEAKKEGRAGKFVVVGQRGRRWTVWREGAV